MKSVALMPLEEAIVECLRRNPDGLPASVLDGLLRELGGLDWGEYRAALGRLEGDGRIVGEACWQGGQRWLIWRLSDLELASGGAEVVERVAVEAGS